MKKNRCLWGAFLGMGLMLAMLLPAKADEAAVAAIRKEYQAIEDGKGWVKKQMKIDSPRLLESSVTRFEAKDGTLKKLVVKSSNDEGKTTEYYYYSKGAVFFAFIDSQYLKHNWEIDAMGDQRSIGEPLKGTLETRLYYVGKNCVRHLMRRAEAPTRKEVAATISKKRNHEFDDADSQEEYRQRGAVFAKARSQEELADLLGR